MRTKAIQTNPSGALPADRHDAQAEEEDLAAAAWVADSVQALGKCIRLSVPSVAKTLKCHSVPEVTGPYTAAIALASSPPVAAAGHINSGVGGPGYNHSYSIRLVVVRPNRLSKAI